VRHAATLSGRHIELGERDRRELAKSLSGPLLTSADAGYDDARTIWNRMIDRCPALIVRCAGVDDVVAALRFARERDLLTSIKGGGHNVTGYAVCADGLMLDLSAMEQRQHYHPPVPVALWWFPSPRHNLPDSDAGPPKSRCHSPSSGAGGAPTAVSTPAEDRGTLRSSPALSLPGRSARSSACA
jgi:FAD binding domain